jgi:hypothetical protein
MTTAGIGALMIAAECLGDGLGNGAGNGLSRTQRKDLDDACTRALAWLAANWSVDENPHKGKSWLYYFLYGLERVGALMQREYIGEHPWYVEGARFLTDAQRDDGSWSQDSEQADTCFALLFLKRATPPSVTGIAD